MDVVVTVFKYLTMALLLAIIAIFLIAFLGGIFLGVVRPFVLVVRHWWTRKRSKPLDAEDESR